jgi:hypothetical protein
MIQLHLKGKICIFIETFAMGYYILPPEETSHILWTPPEMSYY